LVLPRPLHDGIVAHAREEFPNEACGVLAGQGEEAVAVYPMRNAEASPVVYRFDEREQLRVFNEIEAKGWEILAFFHSHTHTEAYPSPTDVTQAPDPSWHYVIVSLKREIAVLRSYRIVDGVISEEGVGLDGQENC
jgi:[CysO sulfur-carrier protein]-S-L-cysteine hydrolase